MAPIPAAMRIRVIANARSGTVLAQGPAAFAAAVMDAFDRLGVVADVRLVKGDDLGEALRAALAEPDLRVVIAGGDGTLMRLLPIIVAADRPIGLLPLGTVNLLGKDLGFTGDLLGDARLAAGADISRVSLAKVNPAEAGSTLFHSNAGLGILGRMAREREEARRRFPFSRVFSFVWAAARTLVLARTMSIAFEVDGQLRHVRADAVLVTNNPFDDQTLRRHSLDDGLLEVHVVTAERVLDRLALAFAVLRGRWRNHRTLYSLQCHSLQLERRDRARTRLAVDGELLTLRGRIAITATSQTISVYGRTVAPKA
jgi:diacylglycerol kinase family enzyme